jgi:hypothetical protein
VFHRTSGSLFYNPNDAYEELKPFYTCIPRTDCDYLKNFFSGRSVEFLRKNSMRDDRFYIYIPIITTESRFVLLFERWNSYGKIGS